MNKFRKMLHTILFLPFPANIITVGISLTLVAVVLALGLEGPVAYFAYLFSAYGLAVLVAFFIPGVKKGIAKARTVRVIDRYFSDLEFRSRVMLYSGTAFNILYALFKLISGIVIPSYFFVTIAVYYLMLAVLKFSLVRSDYKWKLRSDEIVLHTEWRIYRRTGWLMSLLNLTLAGIIIQVIRDGDSYRYPGTLIFAMAAYAFYRISIVIVSLIRDRKRRTPLFSAAKSLDLAVAVVSMFTLQTAMLHSFNSDGSSTGLFNTISGIAVLMIILGISLFMVFNARRRTKPEDHNGSQHL